MARQNVCEQSSGMFLNKDIKAFIDMTPCDAQPTWAEIRKNITAMSDDMNETVEEYEYYDGDESEVTAVQHIFGVEGNTNYNDIAQRDIINRKHLTGVGRKSNFRVVYPWGTIVEGSGTLTDIVVVGGNSKERLSLSFNLAFDSNSTSVALAGVYPEVVLGALPDPVYVAAGKLLKYTFPNVTDSDKAKQPISHLLPEKLGLIIGVDTPVSEYMVREYVDGSNLIIELVLPSSVVVDDDILVVNKGVFTKSLQSYTQSVATVDVA